MSGVSTEVKKHILSNGVISKIMENKFNDTEIKL